MTGEPRDACHRVAPAAAAEPAVRAVGEALARELRAELPGRRRPHGTRFGGTAGGEHDDDLPGGAAGGAAQRLGAACAAAGRALAGAGVPLGEALDALAAEWGSVMGGDPSFAATRAFADAWGDGTLAWLHRLDCADPMTGLPGPGHLRTRVGEVLRAVRHRAAGAGPVLVVADLARPGQGPPAPLVDALLVARAGTVVRTVFLGDDTVATLGRARLGVLTREHPALEGRVALLERMLATVAAPGEERGGGHRSRRIRVQVVALPADAEAAHLTLDGLLLA